MYLLNCPVHRASMMRLSSEAIGICTVPRCIFGRVSAERGMHPWLVRCPAHPGSVMSLAPGGYRTCDIRGCRYSPGMLAAGRHPWVLDDEYALR